MPTNLDIHVPAGLTPGPPAFVGIGAQKSGTSWVHHCIMHHPECYYPQFLSAQIDKQHQLKEHHFFDHFSCRELQTSDINAYHRWCATPVDKITGEWTPSYFSDPWVPRLLKLSAPNTKILVLLRDPVERYISGISFSQRKNKHPNDELASIDINTDNYPHINRRIAFEHFHRGLYNTHLQHWRRHFQPSSILVLQYEQLLENPHRHLKDIFRHIGLDDSYQVPDEIVSQRLKHIPSAKKLSLSNTQRQALIESYQDEVSALLTQETTIDVNLWPNFCSHRRT